MTKLGDVPGLRAIQTGPFGTQLKADEYDPNGHGAPVVSVGEIREGYIRIADETPRVGVEVQSRLGRFMLDERDVVVARKGAVDRSAWVSVSYGPLFLGSDAIAVRFESSTMARFYGYALQSRAVRGWLVRHAPGTTMLSMNGAVLGAVPVSQLSTRQMTGIVKVLGALDDKIVANRQLGSATEELIDAQATLIKSASPVQVALGDILRLNYGRALPVAHRRGGEVSVVGSGGVVGAHDDPLVPGPCVVVGRKGTIGATYWVDGPAYPIDTTYWVEPTGVPLIYAFTVLKNIDFSGMSTDSAVPGLNRDRAYAIPVALPSPEDLHSFGRIAASLLERAAAARDENQRLETTRDELLPLLMSGKITVKDAEKAVEEVV